jgi:hypothetical protein
MFMRWLLNKFTANTDKVLYRLRDFHRLVYGQRINYNDNIGDFYSKYDSVGAEDLIRSSLLSCKPTMISRFGTVELDSLIWAFYLKNPIRRYSDFITQQIEHWQFPRYVFPALENNAGFFPANEETLLAFYYIYISDMREIDVLGSWQKREVFFKSALPNAHYIRLADLGPPVASREPWTELLAGKNILVVHPFEDSIRFQYSRREKLFLDPRILPEFNLITLKAIQSIGNNAVPFDTWFQALDFMKSRISAIEFDIALIGCGSYGLPLAAHVKRLGKKAIHFGGALQVLFGIKGKRWDENIGKGWDENSVSEVYNDYWIRPLDTDRPSNFMKVEDGIYW